MARKHKHPEHVNHERWLVSYADFITLLFAFFTVLYATSQTDQQKIDKAMNSMQTAFNINIFDDPSRSAGAQAVALDPNAQSILDGLFQIAPTAAQQAKGSNGNSEKEFQDFADEMRDISHSPELEGLLSVRVEKRGVIVSLKDAAFFASGSASINPSAEDALSKVASKLSEKEFSLTVEGHTDDVPIKGGKYPSNWELSTARASIVTQMLAEKYKIDPGNLSAAGYGSYKPIADNSTAEGRARNRRIDIVIKPPFAESKPRQTKTRE